VEAALRDADAAVNLVGVLFQRGPQRFEAVHTAGAATIAQAAAAMGLPLVHVSALGADENSSSLYARSKAAGEKAVFAAKPDASILRPSIMFGPEDTFFNRFAAMARISPVLPLIGGGMTRFQPVFVGDTALAVTAALDGKTKPGTIYELGGPEIRSFKELMQYMLGVIERRRLLLPVPFPLASAMAAFTGLLPKPPLTADQVEMLKRDNVVSEEAMRDGRTLDALGIDPVAMELVVPSYLWRYRKAGQFSKRFAG
jgi:NADH dehydrogenase